MKDNDKDYAFICECGSVNWLFRKDGKLECSNCQSQKRIIMFNNIPNFLYPTPSSMTN